LPCLDFGPGQILLTKGFLAYGGVRAGEGQLPNHDFVSLQPPLSFYLAAATFKLLGTSLASLGFLGARHLPADNRTRLYNFALSHERTYGSGRSAAHDADRRSILLFYSPRCLAWRQTLAEEPFTSRGKARRLGGGRCFLQARLRCARFPRLKFEAYLSVFQFQISGKGATFFRYEFRQEIRLSGVHQFLDLLLRNLAL